MKGKFEGIVFKLFLFVTILVTGTVLFSQPPGGTPPGGFGVTGSLPPCWPPTRCIPIDAGIGFLIAAGIGFGAKKLYRKDQ